MVATEPVNELFFKFFFKLKINNDNIIWWLPMSRAANRTQVLIELWAMTSTDFYRDKISTAAAATVWSKSDQNLNDI